METKNKRHEDSQVIESILYTFWSDFVRIIKHNINISTIVGQLSAALIEQFSGFLYPKPVNERVELFIHTYMEQYFDLCLMETLRNSLDRRLGDRLGAIMTGIPVRLLKNGRIGLDEKEVLRVFVQDLRDAIDKASQDLRTNEDMRRHALTWVRDHPVPDYGYTSLYTSEEQSKLQKYYEPLLMKHPLFYSQERFSFGFNYGDGGHFIVILFNRFYNRGEDSRVPLEVFIELMELKRPEEVLTMAD